MVFVALVVLGRKTGRRCGLFPLEDVLKGSAWVDGAAVVLRFIGMSMLNLALIFSKVDKKSASLIISYFTPERCKTKRCASFFLPPISQSASRTPLQLTLTETQMTHVLSDMEHVFAAIQNALLGRVVAF